MASNSNSLALDVPTLTSLNYLVWAPKMTNVLWASRLNWVLRKTHPEESEEGSDQTKVNEWDNTNNFGVPVLDFTVFCHQGYSTAKEVWDGLESQFAKPSITSIYMEFKAMMDTTIPEGNHPAPAFAKITAHFVHPKEFKYDIPYRVQVMIILAKFPQYMNVVAHLLNINPDDITVQSIDGMATVC
ncbi:hypothetical protein PAXRUDRAFT_156923 [Paxillus rubicundulus Ve08.2h10]|uniref:Uncharacterized protein n=1 Tax=Paxillus rubicundulus Ve08.2h10 TaxID=930991 RepID=A0A0D0DPU2_9AGAM|nr:hypothetical protein PAXRUDRAFT_156923 [Paxillus rubicundulus Ve08.2h10]